MACGPRAAVFFVVVTGCARSMAPPAPAAEAASPPPATSVTEPPVQAAAKEAEPDAGHVVQVDPDGNDDDEDPGSGHAPDTARWEKVGTPPLALTRICDLTPSNGALFAAHAHVPLGTDGATITRFSPGDDTKPFRVAFDWNRPGEPTKGGGAGQGFLRVHAIDGRLFVPDADPPYAGLGIADWGTEGYVFVSDDKGVFAPARAPHFRPPASAGVLPRAYHVIDVIRYRGALYASTGSVPPQERAWKGPSPGALHRASEDGSKWTYDVDYPRPWKDGVWRLTYLVRFKDRLYAGIQDYDGRDPNDFVIFAPEASSALRQEDARPTRITRRGASGTLRWWVDTRATPHRLYWLAWTRDGIALRVTIDGDHWAALDLHDAGIPSDITRFRDGVVVLTERGLFRLTGSAVEGAADIEAMGGVAEATTKLIAAVAPRSPFEVTDFFCAAPLAVMDNVLYAGGQRGGSLYRLVE